MSALLTQLVWLSHEEECYTLVGLYNVANAWLTFCMLVVSFKASEGICCIAFVLHWV